MRFFLDNDVDAEVASFLVRKHHICWRAGEAGLADAIDELIAIYAEDQHAVLISHDKAFAKKRMANTRGQHVWLHCQHVDAVEVLAKHLTEVEAKLARWRGGARRRDRRVDRDLRRGSACSAHQP